MQNTSLRPELEFELLKLVLLREKYIQRLQNKLTADTEKAIQSQKAIARAAKAKPRQKPAVDPVLFVPRVDIGLIGLIDVLRECTVQIIETIRLWERAQLTYPNVVTYKWNGRNYLEKVHTDLAFLQDYRYVVDWLGFSPVNNPFLVPPEVLRDEVMVPANAFIIFGIDPPPLEEAHKKKAVTRPAPSPYSTPIINDPQVFIHLSARSKLNAKFKSVEHGGDGGYEQDDTTFQDTYNGTNTGNNTYRSSVQSREGTRGTSDPAKRVSQSKAEVGAYQCYLNSELIHKLRACWKILQQVHSDATLQNTALNRHISEYSVGDTDAHLIQHEQRPPDDDQRPVYDESRVFASPQASALEAGLHGSAGPPPAGMSSGDFKGFYNTSTQSLPQLSPGAQAVTPSQLQQMAFQTSKEYFQRSLHDTSGVQFAAQDAANATHRLVPLGATGPTNATAESTSVATATTAALAGAGAVASAGPVQMGPGVHLFTEDSAEGQWGSASDAGAVLRVEGMHGVHPNPGVHNDTGAAHTGLRGNVAHLPGVSGGVSAGSGEEIGKGLATTSSQLWTPHEIHLQRQVQRRGGELYILTAAGTQGRLKAPWRRTRFERLEDDVQHLHEQSALMHMAVEEAITRAVEKMRAEGAEPVPISLPTESTSTAGAADGSKATDSTKAAPTAAPTQTSGSGSAPMVKFADKHAQSTPVKAPGGSPTARSKTPPSTRSGGEVIPGPIQMVRPSTPSKTPPSPTAAAAAAAAVGVPPSPAATQGSPGGEFRRARAAGAGLLVTSRPPSAGSAQGAPGAMSRPPSAGGAAQGGSASAAAPPGSRPGSADRPATAPRILLTGRGGAAAAAVAAPVSVAAMAASEMPDEGSDSGTDGEAETDEEQSDGDGPAQQPATAPIPPPPSSQSSQTASAGEIKAPEGSASASAEDPALPPPPPKQLAPVYRVEASVAEAIRELKLHSIEVERRRVFMKYQYDHFKMVSTGNLTDLNKQRRLHKMDEGQTLEEDQEIAMAVEDKMAFRIQRSIRRKFGRALRQAMLRKMNAAALRIQGVWRRCKVHMLSLKRGAQLRLALILQRLYRGGSVNETMRKLKREALERVASKTLQRVFRGYLGRRRLNLKREFVGCLTQATQHVSIKELTPGHIEELADALDMFCRDYTLDLPPAVLSVLRAVFYLFNGDNSECVVVSKDGYIEKKYIRAATATWQGAKLILRRKSRFLRRLRALVANTCLPNPSKFNFTPDCVIHLEEVIKGISPSDFNEMGIGKYCILKLLEYCRCLHRAYELQDMFPEYFDPGQSAWFRYLMNIRQKYDRADLLRRIQSKCKFRLESQRREYTREGRSWRHVSDAMKRNEFDLEEARIARAKAKKRYESYVAELEAAELKKVVTLEGIARAKTLSVQVAQGDLKEYVQSVVIPDEARLRELYYAVDTRSLSLLQTKAEIVTSLEQNERNKQSRDFDKIMKTKRLHEICADLGSVLADLTVLLNNWKALLASIGGYQYVKDLVGQRKAYYEHIRKTSLALMKKRRALLEDFEADLQSQYDKVIQIAYDLGVKACNTYWDSPTVVEVEAEAEENRECCRREADFELRMRRQTEHVHIPPAPFIPVLLLIDSRVPRKLKAFLTERLQKFDFTVCKRAQTDDKLVLEMQQIIDEKQHVILFANRGAHSLARLTFLSAFNSIVSALIPTPHIVALDCTLALRVEDWHTMFSVEQPGMTAFNVGDSANCDLSLGKLRNLSSLFRECLVYEDGESYENESESEDSGDEKPSVSVNPSRKVSFAASVEVYKEPPTAGDTGDAGAGAGAAVEAAQPNGDLASQSESGSGSGQPAPTESAKLNIAEGSTSDATPPAPAAVSGSDVSVSGAAKPLQRSGSVTFQSDASGALASARSTHSKARRKRLDAIPVPTYVRTAFMRDFHDFITHLAHKLTAVDKKTVVEIRYKVKVPGVTPAPDPSRMEYGAPSPPPQFSHGYLYSDMVLAATISTVLNLWQAPLTEWTSRDIARGSNAFRKRCLKLSYDELCEILEMREFVDSSVVTCKRLERAMSLQDAWAVLRKHDFYVHPARNILVRWTCEIVELMTRFSLKGGRADENFQNCNAAHVRHLKWRSDVMDPENGGIQLLGDLLHACMQKALIYEDKHCMVKYYYDRGDLSSTERQCIDSFLTPQHVYVYHSNEETFVGVKVDNTRLSRGQSVPNWYFFSRMRVRDLITMLQPNYTEIVEGKVKKFNIKPGGTHKWYKLLSEWASLDNISKEFQITLLRSRYLVLSKLGFVKGYLVRMEIFEERFGEVRILVYGILPNGGAVNYLVDRKKVYDLLNYCDVHAEKDKLDALDTQSVAYIFSDRLEIRPSKMWQDFLNHGELLPKSLDREVQLHLRKRQGPGRYTGRRVLMVGQLRLVITLYELDSDTNSHELRVVLYETRHSQTAEYRLSSMERLMLFQDDKPILEQICARLRHVYCDITDKTRTLIVLDDSDVPRFDAAFEVDGDEEYEVKSQASDDETEKGDEEDEEDSDDEDADSESRERDRTSSSVRRGSASGRRHSTSSKSKGRRGSRMSRASRMSRLSSQAQRPPSGWGWAIYFNRAPVTELKGNLQISVGLSVPQRGFTFFVFDPRTHREGYRFVSFHDACALTSDKTLESLEEDLGNMDESVAYDLADEFMGLVEIQNSNEDRLAVVLSGEETEQEDLLIARLGEFHAPKYETRSMKKPTIPVQRVTIFVHGAKDLERIGAFGTRNPVCIVKWNFREVGRTKICRNTLAPRWQNASFLVMTPKNQELKDCSLDLELFDTSADGKNKLTDFLGCIKIAGDNLVEFLDSERPRWMECEKAKRLHGEENKHAKGFIEVSGTRKDTNLAAKQAEEEAAAAAAAREKESAKLAGFGVSGRFGAGWFGASSKNLGASVASGADNSESTKTSGAGAAAAPNLGALSKKFGLSTRAPMLSGKVDSVLEEPSLEDASQTPIPQPQLASSERQPGAGITWTDKSAADHSSAVDAASVAPSAELALPTSTVPEVKVVPFYLGVVGADGLPSGVEVTCTVRFNSFVVQKIVATTTQDNYMSAKAAFYSSPVTLAIPPGLPLAACELQVTLSREDNHHKTVPLAEVVLRGSLLVNFLRRGSQWVEAKRSAPTLPHGTSFGGAFGAAAGLLGHTADAGQDLRPCRLEMIGSYQPIRHEVYKIKVLSARNLPKADVFGSSDPFVKLLLDGRLVAQTQVIKNNVNPTWDETFTIPLALQTSILDATLLIEVYDHDNVSDHDLLGVHTVSGAALQTLLCPAADADGAVAPQTLPLEMEQKVKGKTKVVSCGDITVLGCGMVGPALSPTAPTQHPSVGSELNALDQHTVSAEGDSVEAPVDPALKIVEDAYEELHNLAPDEYTLGVKTARGLMNSDGLKSSNTMVNVYFNGELVGHTAELPHGPVLDWSSSAATAAAAHSGDRTASHLIKLTVPRGQTLGSCRLELQLLALEHHHHIGLHMTTTTTATVLGGRVITGRELEDLAGVAFKLQPGEPHPPRRVVGAGGAKYYPLESSARPAPALAAKTAPAPAATAAAAAPAEPAPTLGLLKGGLSFRTSTKSIKPKHRADGAMDASALAAASNAQAAAAAAARAALPVNLTPQGDLGLILVPAVSSGESFNSADRDAHKGPKNIVIEEPELIRENSTLAINVMSIMDILPAVLWAKEKEAHTQQQPQASVAAASGTSDATPPAAGGPGGGVAAHPEEVDVMVRWNGITVDKFLALVDPKAGTVSLPHPVQLTLRLPFNLTIRDCHLELLLWKGKLLVGSAAYWGDVLAHMCGVHAASHGDDELNEGETPAPPATSGPEQTSVVTSADPLWHSLRPSLTIPTELQATNIKGRVLLAATLTRPILQKKSATSHRDPNRKRTFFRVIGSDLTAEKKHWSHFFKDDAAGGGDHDDERSLDDFDETAELDKDRVASMRRGSQVQATPEGRTRKRLLSDISRQSSQPESEGQSMAIPAATGDPVAAALGSPGVLGADAAQLKLMADRANFQKLRLELSAVGFTVTVHQEIDEHRVCWRGRVMPKNFQGSEGTRKAMMVSRASRLIRTHGINDMQVMAEVHQLNDTGEEAEEVNDLPICVKEVLSDGPGLVKRTYRVEISANNGVLMGFADIKDDIVDLERVIGKADVPRLLPADRKLWKLGTIFQHVVRERVILDMLMGKGNTKGKDGRREGIMQAHDELAELTGSIISIMRDPSPEEVAKAARAAKAAAEAKEAAEKAAAEAAATASTKSGFSLGGFSVKLPVTMKGFKLGFSSKKAEATPTVVEEDETVLENVNTNDTTRGSTMGAYSTHTHSVMDEDDDEIAQSHKIGRQWLRIHARTHRVVGKPLRSVVLLLATPSTDPLFHSDHEKYFRMVLGRPCLLQFDVLFRCKDSFTKETRELFLTAAELDEWLPQSHPIDMTTRFRRDKLGAYLLQYLSIRFTEAGKIGLYLIKENANVSSSIDDLIAEDELQQEKEREENQ